MGTLIALLRGINVGGARKLPMAELRAACAAAGLRTTETYIQSGNMVLAHHDPVAAEAAIEALVAERFGFNVPVVARTAEQWRALVESCPFPEEAEGAPRSLHVLLCKRPPVDDAIEALRGRARDGEKVAHWGEEIAIHFVNGAGDSRLSPTLIDRLIGTPATARNWNTMLKLLEMVER